MRRRHRGRVQVPLRLLDHEQPVEELDLVVGVEESVADHALVPQARDPPETRVRSRDEKRRHRASTIARGSVFLNVSIWIPAEPEMVRFAGCPSISSATKW